MDPMSAGFLGFMLLGVLWVVWRIGSYIRFHRGREHAWSQFDSKEEFHQFLDNLKNPKQDNKPAETTGNPNRSAPLSLKETALRHDRERD